MSFRSLASLADAPRIIRYSSARAIRSFGTWDTLRGFLPSDIKGLRQIRYWSPGILRVRLEELVKDLTSTGGLGAAEDMWITRIDERLSMYPDGLLMRQIAEHLSISAPIARGFIQKMIRDGIVEARGYGPSTRYVKIAGPRRAA